MGMLRPLPPLPVTWLTAAPSSVVRIINKIDLTQFLDRNPALNAVRMMAEITLSPASLALGALIINGRL